MSVIVAKGFRKGPSYFEIWGVELRKIFLTNDFVNVSSTARLGSIFVNKYYNVYLQWTATRTVW